MNAIEMQKYYNELAKVRVKCACSHSMFFPVYSSDVQICSYCGNKVYRNDKVKFAHLLNEQLKNKRCKNA